MGEEKGYGKEVEEEVEDKKMKSSFIDRMSRISGNHSISPEKRNKSLGVESNETNET